MMLFVLVVVGDLTLPSGNYAIMQVGPGAAALLFRESVLVKCFLLCACLHVPDSMFCFMFLFVCVCLLFGWLV